jgi:hypothetical protein
MKKLLLSALLAVAAVTTVRLEAQAQVGCPTAPAPIVLNAQTISTNTTWTRNNIYLLNGFVYVDNGATLTIEPGTIIKGDQTNKGALIIRRGSRIDARGTVNQPIVFTSNQPAGSRAAGDWGGIIICGNAPVNLPGNPTIEGGVQANFGGTDPNDNSGFLQYVRIEFPGVAFLPNNEINGLTLGGVGAGTTIDHIQVSYSGDDSYEWFGGTVNAKYLIALRGTDDDFDTDNGFAGKVQFGVALRDPAVGDFASGGVSNGFESDNDANSSVNTPVTSAVFSNMSIFVPSGTLASPYASSNGAQIRRNSAQSIFNSVFTGRPYGLLLDGTATQANAASGALVFSNNVLAGFAANRVARVNSGTSYNVKQFVGAANDTSNTVAALALNPNNFNLTAGAFQPQASSPLGSGAAFSNAKLSSTFFTAVSYRGAFAPSGAGTDWTAGWTSFDPQNFCYNTPGRTTLAARSKSDQLQGLAVYPNPSAGAAQLSFELKRSSATTVRVLDLTGREVAVVAAGKTLSAGPQVLSLPASLPAGVYVASITTSETSQSVRFVVAGR